MKFTATNFMILVMKTIDVIISINNVSEFHIDIFVKTVSGINTSSY